MLTGNIFLWSVSSLFVLSFLVQLFYYLYVYLAPIVRKKHDQQSPIEPVSVIICARNEAENLLKFLPAVLEQDYPDYEVIVVNDCSEDDSDIVLGQFMQKYPRLHVSSLAQNPDPKFTHYKKFALFIGIKAAKNELLLFTDADCEPVSNNWISTIVSNFSKETDIVLGYGGYTERDSLLNKYIRYDTMMIALQYLGLALRERPYMGVGRNLAYRRSLFFKNRGFSTHMNIMSGDDDLFVHDNATKTNVAVELRSESFTQSIPLSTFKEWINQKRRHFTTAPKYDNGLKTILFIEPFTRVLFYATFIILLSQLFYWRYVLGIFATRLIVQIILFNSARKLFNEKHILLSCFIFDLFSPFINFFIYIFKGRKKQVKWK